MAEVQDVDDVTNNIATRSDVQDDIQFSAKGFFYTWTLSNFLNCMKFADAKILSPEFEFAGTMWQLGLQAICKNEKLSKIKIRLVKSEKSSSKYYIKCRFSLPIASGSSVTRETISSFMGESVWGHRSSFKYRERSTNGSSFIINDKLTINCELFVLSLSQASKKQTSVSHTSNQSDNPMTNPIIKALLVLISFSHNVVEWIFQIPATAFNYTNNEIERPNVRRMPVEESRYTRGFEMIALCLLIFFIMGFCPNRNSSNGKLMLNMTEVNELIIDSTLKIRNIAEALNLTDVKIKSSELLAWYHKNYNLSTRNLESLKEKISPFVISPHVVLNVSADMIKTLLTVNNINETVGNDEH